MTIGVFYGKGGERHEIPLDARMYKEAAEAGCSVPQYLERKHQDKTDAATQPLRHQPCNQPERQLQRCTGTGNASWY